MTSIKTYSELQKIGKFRDRYEYLRLDGTVGADTFGFDRYVNQLFYRSKEWRAIRDEVILRDGGCDLGVEGYDIHGRIIIHHMNPLTRSDILSRSDILLDPEYLITTTHDTHNAIHYGNAGLLISEPTERTPNDTCPWKR